MDKDLLEELDEVSKRLLSSVSKLCTDIVRITEKGYSGVISRAGLALPYNADDIRINGIIGRLEEALSFSLQSERFLKEYEGKNKK